MPKTPSTSPSRPSYLSSFIDTVTIMFNTPLVDPESMKRPNEVELEEMPSMKSMIVMSSTDSMPRGSLESASSLSSHDSFDSL